MCIARYKVGITTASEEGVMCANGLNIISVFMQVSIFFLEELSSSNNSAFEYS